MVMTFALKKKKNLIDQNLKWYQKKWNRRQVLKNSEVKLVSDFEINLQKTTTSRRPYFMLEEKETKTKWICDMACPQENNVEKKRL